MAAVWIWGILENPGVNHVKNQVYYWVVVSEVQGVETKVPRPEGHPWQIKSGILPELQFRLCPSARLASHFPQLAGIQLNCLLDLTFHPVFACVRRASATPADATQPACVHGLANVKFDILFWQSSSPTESSRSRKVPAQGLPLTRLLNSAAMLDRKRLLSLLNSVAEEVVDSGEETFFLFSNDLPSNNLGMLDEKASLVSVEVAGREYAISQSTGLLNSNIETGTTGALLWKVTPLLAEWLVDRTNILWMNSLLSSETTVLELGCGVAGLIGLALSPIIFRYILTDQNYVMKLLNKNVTSNTSQVVSTTHGKVARGIKPPRNVCSNNLAILTYDWENDTPLSLRAVLNPNEDINLVVLCDCVYNEFLIPPLANTCREICSSSKEKQTILLIAQQLRSHEVFQEWMETLHSSFQIWRLADEALPESLGSKSGYVVHIALPRLPSD